ncbi:hypothetical protein APY94_02115 [Thermococcus celericrescens]|uniref:XACb0070 ribbon-helix-helix domain-containing protein n=1 Tax=Thermococcus celericrescens TaxID=227598 RepID=A0A100XZA0_9EURY|nr:hypothetical protein [Thermococcus celericrescens]KUH34451.1 hypothetical protein APY94_02115 [Thermococcus celericrescens]
MFERLALGRKAFPEKLMNPDHTNVDWCGLIGVINVSVDDDVEKKFRELVAKKYGKIRGALGMAVTEAMKLWIKKAESEEQ